MSPERLRVAIVDDEPLAVERLRHLCVAMADVTVVGTAQDGEAALALLGDVEPDVVLLDIAMPGLSGLEVAAAVADLTRPPAVVFCTAFDQHALAAFEVAAVDYLLKPVASDRLARALARARAQPVPTVPVATPTWLEELWVPHRSEMVRLAVGDIDRIEAERDYVRLHVRGHGYLLHHTMASLEARLDPAMFVRLHRSAIVRADAVVRLRHDGLGVWTAVLTDGSEQRISRGGLTAARQIVGGRVGGGEQAPRPSDSYFRPARQR